MNETRLFTTLRIIYVFSFVINFAAQHDTASHTIERNVLPCADRNMRCVLLILRIEVYILFGQGT